MFANADALWAHINATHTPEEVNEFGDDELVGYVDKLPHIDAQLEFLADVNTDDARECMSTLVDNLGDREDRVYYCETYRLPLCTEDEEWADGAAADEADDVRYSFEMGIAAGVL